MVSKKVRELWGAGGESDREAESEGCRSGDPCVARPGESRSRKGICQRQRQSYSPPSPE
jgi:hypothetical protein